MFLPSDPSYQDIWLKPKWMILAYAQALQYWAEEANLPVPSEPHPLAMSVRELRQCIGKYTTFSEHDVFEGLGNALPETRDENTGTPPVDSTATPAMTDIEDTQLSPRETQLVEDPIPPSAGYKFEAKDENRWTPLADDTTVLLAKPKAVIKEDLPATHGTSPTRPDDLVAPMPHLQISWLIFPLWLTVWRVEDKNTQSG